MRNKLLTMLAMLTLAIGGNAQTLQVLGDNHAMQRVEVKTHYLLLPVQEKEEIANIHIIVDNEQRQAFNVKLAVDKVDYYVPVDIRRFGSESILLDIKAHPGSMVQV